MQLENQILLNKRPTCCSMRTNISLWNLAVFRRQININKFTESLIVTVLQLFTCEPEIVENGT